MNNIAGKFDGLVQYIVEFIRKMKGYVDEIITFFEELRDKIEGLLEYVEGKIQTIQGIVGDLKMTSDNGGGEQATGTDEQVIAAQ